MLLDALGPSEREAVTSCLRPRRHRAGQVLFNDGDVGDCMHLVNSGRLSVHSTTPDGVTVTLRVVHPGEFFGELALVHSAHRRTGRVVALEASETSVLSRSDFESLRQTQPAIDRLLVAALAERLVRTSELVTELMMPPEQRVWRRLAVLAEAYGSEPVRMSQEELARAAGTVRQTVNRALRHAEVAGIVELQRGSVRVVDPAALTLLATRSAGGSLR